MTYIMTVLVSFFAGAIFALFMRWLLHGAAYGFETPEGNEQLQAPPPAASLVREPRSPGVELVLGQFAKRRCEHRHRRNYETQDILVFSTVEYLDLMRSGLFYCVEMTPGGAFWQLKPEGIKVIEEEFVHGCA